MEPSPSSPVFGETIALRRRATGFVLAGIANALLLLLLFTLAPAPTPRKGRETGITTVTLLPAAEPSPKPSHESEQRHAVKQPERPKQRKTSRPAPVTPVPPPPLNMIVLSRETFAASDISRLPTAVAPAEPTSGDAHAGDTKRASGQGPNGEELYAAEWYREPSNAELGGYLPASAPHFGWATIACRTASGYRVEDCVELGQSPPGSGLARAVRQAAWQFRVRPPRVGGKALVGSWVSIRIDFSEKRPG